MATITQGMFGVAPEELMAQRQQALNAQALQYAQLDPMQQAQMSFYKAGSQLGTGLGGLMGAQDPELMRVRQRQQMLQGLDLTNPESLLAKAQEASQMGDYQAAQELYSKAQELSLGAAKRETELAQQRKVTAEATKIERAAAQDDQLREELSKLGPSPTQEQIVGVVAKYGSPDKVLAVVQGSADKEAAREQAIQMQKERLAAQLEQARQAGADRRMIAQMQVDARKEIAALTASLKGPSATVIKAQEKADKIAEGQAGLGETLSTAKTLVNDLASKGGMTSTSKSSLSNLITSLGTSTVGQIGSRMMGTEVQSKRDELASVRLQLFNAVKEATGMSSTQLNSNVELQTWLKSLGSPDMTKEANLAILTNLENRYLKGMKPAAGTADNPIVLK